jgi:ferredoxin
MKASSCIVCILTLTNTHITIGGSPEEADEYETAVDSIVQALTTCPVDAILFVHKIKEVDSGIDRDLQALETVLDRAKLFTVRCFQFSE